MQKIIEDLSLLEEPSEPIRLIGADGASDDADAKWVIGELAQALEADPDLTAVSAPQIGIKKRAFAIRFGDGPKFFVNPIIKSKSGMEMTVESFCNLPRHEILLSRPAEVSAVYYDGDLKYEDNKFTGPAAKLFDQQCQFLDGVTPMDIGLVSDVDESGSFFDLTDEEKEEAVSLYRKFVRKKSESLSEELLADEETAGQYKQMAFMEKVITGQASVVADEPVKKQNRAQRRAAAKRAKRIGRGRA